jgi:hypothetical protein
MESNMEHPFYGEVIQAGSCMPIIILLEKPKKFILPLHQQGVRYQATKKFNA